MTISLNDFITQVAAMREKQKEYFKNKNADWSVKKIILQESKALEQNVDRMIKIHQEMVEGQTSFLRDDHA